MSNDDWKHPSLCDLATVSSSVCSPNKLEELIIRLHSMLKSSLALDQEELLVVNQALGSLSAHVRAKCIDVLAQRASPKLWLRGGSAGHMVVWHTDDGDARVRDRAYDCLRQWSSFDKDNSSSPVAMERSSWIHTNLDMVHGTTTRGLLDIELMVRCTALLLLAKLSTRWPNHILIDVDAKPGCSSDSRRSDESTSSVVDDAFNRICMRLQDPAHQVRQLAMRTLSELAESVTDECLVQTLEKTVMTDRHVRQSTLSGGAYKSRTLPSTNILASGSSGAIINGLEDEFSEVRCITLATVTRIAPLSTRFATECQELLVDMLTDDIQDVRLAAVRALSAVSDQVPLQSEQVTIITSAMADGSGRIRRRLHHLLSQCRLSSAPCLISLLDGLLQNLRRYPQDRDSLWRCAASVGRRHPLFVEVCLPSLLRTHSWLSGPEPNWEDSAYLTVLLLVLNAEPGAPTMRSKFPRPISKTRLYLYELVPTLLPKQDRFLRSTFESHYPGLSLPPKRQRLDNSAAIFETKSVTNGLQTYITSVIKRIYGILLETNAPIKDESISTSSHPVSVSPPLYPPFSFHSTIQQSKSSLLARLVFTDLAQTIQKLDRDCQMEGLVQWALCLSTSAWFLLSMFSGALHSKVLNRNSRKFLMKSLKSILKAKYLFVGKSEGENLLVSTMCKNLGSLLMESSDSVSNPNVFTDTLRCFTSLFESLLSGIDSLSMGSMRHLTPIRLVLLQPSSTPLLSTLTSRSMDESEDTVCDNTWAPYARPVFGCFEGREPERVIPEIRFTATIGSVSIRIRALIIGLDLSTARDHVCVLIRRPDLQLKSTTLSHSVSGCDVFTWWPPHCSWHSAADEHPNSTTVSGKGHQLDRVELRTHVELSAGQWSDAGTIELGIGYQVNQNDSKSVLSVTLNGSFILPMMNRTAFEKIKLIPCAPISQW